MATTKSTTAEPADTFETKRVENNTARIIVLPPIPKLFPQGVRLMPGLNTVPGKYWAALAERPRAKAHFQRMLEPTRIDKLDRSYIGPQLSVFSVDQARDRPDGLPPPATLMAYPKVEAAIAIMRRCKDRNTLKLWLEEEQKYGGEGRKAVVEAIQTQLATLVGA